MNNIIIKILLKLIRETIEEIFKDTPISKAIESTRKSFQHLDTVDTDLSRWCESEQFRNILDKLKSGERDFDDEDIINSFIQTTGFNLQDKTIETVTEIIKTFLENLELELYSGKDGLGIHALREEKLHENTIETIKTESTKSYEKVIDKIGDTESTLSKGQNLIYTKVEEINENMKKFLSTYQDVSIDKGEKEYHTQIDNALELYNNGQIKAAKRLLLSLREKLKGKTISKKIEFRIATNIAACYMQLSDIETAKKETEKAIELGSEYPVTYTNRAQIAILEKDFDKALELSKKALEIDKKHPNGAATYIYSLFKLNKNSELNQFINDNSWIQENHICLSSLGNIKYEEGIFEDSERFYHSSIEKNNDDPLTYLLLAETILYPIQRELYKKQPLPWLITEKVINKILEAENLLSTALEILKDSDNIYLINSAYINRAVARLNLGKFNECYEDCQKVLQTDINNLTVLRNKGVCCIQLKKFEEAILCFTHFLSIFEEYEIKIMLSVAYMSNNQEDNAIAVLEPLLNLKSNNINQVEIGCLLVNAYKKSKNYDKINDIIQTLTEKWPNNIDVLILQSLKMKDEKKFDEAIEILSKAIQKVTNSERDILTLVLGDLYYSIEQFDKASETYNNIVDKTKDNTILHRYVISLYNSGKIREALTITQTIRKKKKVIPVLSEIEARAYEYIGDLIKAIDMREALNEVEPYNIDNQLRIATLKLRLNDETGAKNTLLTIKLKNVKNNPKHLIEIAKLRDFLKLPDAIPYAYRSRRLDSNNPEIHISYIGIMLSPNQLNNLPLNIDKIDIDCTVYLKNNGEKKIFTIINEDSPFEDKAELARNEISHKSELAVKLLGNKKGEKVTLKESPLGNISYEIVEIKNKYVHAFHESISNFTTFFPDHMGIQKIETKDKDHSKLFNLVDERHSFVDNLNKLYKDKKIPLSSLAKLANTDIMNVWSSLIQSKDLKLIASSGNIIELINQENSLFHENAITLDMTALLTIVALGIEDKIPKRFKEIYIHQSIHDELNDAIMKSEVLGKESFSIGKEGNHYLKYEVTDEVRKNKMDFLKKISQFIKDNIKTVPVDSIMDIPQTEMEMFSKILYPSSLFSILLAKERNLLFYSDDFGLRILANQFGVKKSIWIQNILIDLLNRKIISENLYIEMIERLILLNYHFVHIGYRDIIHFLKINNFILNNNLKRILSLLSNTESEEDSVIVVGVGVLLSLLSSSELFTERQFVVDVILKALINSRNPKQVLNKIRNSVINLSPDKCAFIIKLIQYWKGQQLLI